MAYGGDIRIRLTDAMPEEAFGGSGIFKGKKPGDVVKVGKDRGLELLGAGWAEKVYRQGRRPARASQQLPTGKNNAPLQSVLQAPGVAPEKPWTKRSGEPEPGSGKGQSKSEKKKSK